MRNRCDHDIAHSRRWRAGIAGLGSQTGIAQALTSFEARRQPRNHWVRARLKAGASVLEKLDQAPQHPKALYLSGGVIVAAQAWDQREEPDLESVVSVSSDGGTTWTAVPPPSA